MGGGRKDLGPPIILTGTFNLVSGYALNAALRFNVNLVPRVFRLFGQGARPERLWGHQISTAEILHVRLYCACLSSYTEVKSSRRGIGDPKYTERSVSENFNDEL